MENEKTEPEKSTEPQTTQAEPAVEPQPEIDIYEQMKTLSEEQKTLCPNKISEFIQALYTRGLIQKIKKLVLIMFQCQLPHPQSQKTFSKKFFFIK